MKVRFEIKYIDFVVIEGLDIREGWEYNCLYVFVLYMYEDLGLILKKWKREEFGKKLGVWFLNL